MSGITLYDYQAKAVSDVKSAYVDGYRAPLLVSPTGSGKTFMFAWMASQAQERGKRALILVHRQELLKQASDSLEEMGVDHGLIAPRYSHSFESVQIASVQTLVNRLDRLQDPDLIIIDEAHHTVSGNTWGKVIEHFPNAKILGVTATPRRLDGKGLGVGSGGFFDSMILGPSVRELIDKKRLSDFEFFGPKSKDLDLDGVKRVGGDFVKSQLTSRMDKPTITGSAVEHYRKICPGAPAMAFCASVKHAYHVAEEFRAAGYASKCIEGKMPDSERKQAIRDLGTGALQVLTSCDLVSEGVDIPTVHCGILLRPTESLVLYKQQVGRILRYVQGKTAYILDCVGNWEKHGLPDEEVEWELNPVIRRGRRRSDSDTGLNNSQCLNCFMVFPAGDRDTCPHCGHPIGKKGREIEQVEGELERISPDALAKQKRNRKIAKAKNLKELTELAKDFGYKPGWAYHVWQSRQKRMVRSEPARV